MTRKSFSILSSAVVCGLILSYCGFWYIGGQYRKSDVVDMFNEFFAEGSKSGWGLISPGTPSVLMGKIDIKNVDLSGFPFAWNFSFAIPIKSTGEPTSLIKANETIKTDFFSDNYVKITETLSKLPFRKTHVFYRLRSQHRIDKRGQCAGGTGEASFTTTLLDADLRPILAFFSASLVTLSHQPNTLSIENMRCVTFFRDSFNASANVVPKQQDFISKTIKTCPEGQEHLMMCRLFCPFEEDTLHPLAISEEKILRWAPQGSLSLLKTFLKETQF